MSLSALADKIPDYAKDIKLNLSSLLSEETLSPQQLYGTFLATALASRNPDLISAVGAECARHMTPEAQAAAKAAHAIMAMNNIYYKFTGMVTNPEYKSMQSRLRMNILANPGVDKKDFELWSLAVSAINGCKFCLDSHEARLFADGMTKEQIQTAVRIAAVVHAVSTVLAGEEALQAGVRQAA